MSVPTVSSVLNYQHIVVRIPRYPRHSKVVLISAYGTSSSSYFLFVFQYYRPSFLQRCLLHLLFEFLSQFSCAVFFFITGELSSFVTRRYKGISWKRKEIVRSGTYKQLSTKLFVRSVDQHKRRNT